MLINAVSTFLLTFLRVTASYPTNTKRPPSNAGSGIKFTNPIFALIKPTNDKNDKISVVKYCLTALKIPTGPLNILIPTCLFPNKAPNVTKTVVIEFQNNFNAFHNPPNKENFVSGEIPIIVSEFVTLNNCLADLVVQTSMLTLVLVSTILY